MCISTGVSDTTSQLERALWTAYGRALEADCFDTARDLMDALLALQQRRMLLEGSNMLATPVSESSAAPTPLKDTTRVSTE
jgi:hypothetical protein